MAKGSTRRLCRILHVARISSPTARSRTGKPAPELQHTTAPKAAAPIGVLGFVNPSGASQATQWFKVLLPPCVSTFPFAHPRETTSQAPGAYSCDTGGVRKARIVAFVTPRSSFANAGEREAAMKRHQSPIDICILPAGFNAVGLSDPSSSGEIGFHFEYSPWPHGLVTPGALPNPKVVIPKPLKRYFSTSDSYEAFILYSSICPAMAYPQFE